MGYRSNVSITMKKTDYEEMMKLAKQEDDKIILDFVTKDCSVWADDEIINVVWYDVKWYTDFGYRDVNFVEKFIKDKSYVKTVLGEDISDVSQDYHFIDNEEDEDLFYDSCPTIIRDFDFGNSIEQ